MEEQSIRIGLPPVPWIIVLKPSDAVIANPPARFRMKAEGGWGGMTSPDYDYSADLEYRNTRDNGPGWTLRVHFSSSKGMGSGPFFGGSATVELFNRLQGGPDRIGSAIRWADSVIAHLDPTRGS